MQEIGVSVFGSALLRVEPDLAEIDLGVGTRAKTAAEALEGNRVAVAAVREALRGEGLPDASVQVARVTLEPVYDDFRHRRIEGHLAHVQFRVLVTRLDEVEQTLTAAVEAGANEVQLTYQTSRLRELRAQARQDAFRAARAKAEVYCQAADATLGPVLYIEDRNPQTVRAGMHELGIGPDAPADDDPATPGALEPGSLIVQAAVTVGFALIAG